MSTYLIHHGIKGMKWGIRRYQNADGSLTSAGRNRYGYDKSLMANKNLIQKYRMKSAQKVAYRLNNNFDNRQRYMGLRQRESYKRAKRYWEARAVGQQTPRRNIIKRIYDNNRSKTFQRRAAENAALSTALSTVIASPVFNKFSKIGSSILGFAVPDFGPFTLSNIAKTSAYFTGQSLFMDEVRNRIFGHF